jgi:hypothetical protein
MSDITAFENWENFVNEQGVPTQRAIEYLEEITRHVNLNTVLSGTGSPEGVVEAEPTKLYMDDSGSAGSILYIKKTGTGNTGWILV